MSLRTKLWHDGASKAVTTTVGLGVAWLVGWVGRLIFLWFATIVHAGELEGFADMVATRLDSRLSAIEGQLEAAKAQVARNSAEVTRGRIQAIDASLRDLRVEIQAMETEKAANPAAWGVRDEALLTEWNQDLAVLVCERLRLVDPNTQHPECLLIP